MLRLDLFKFENLNVYQKALIFVNDMYNLSKTWPRSEVFGLTNQLRRAAISIVLNIAEGSSRTNKDFGHFLSLSRGSCFECVAILTIARNQGLVNVNDFTKFYTQCLEIARMLSSLRSKVK